MGIIIREIEEKDYPEVTELLVNELWNNKVNGDYVIPFFDRVKNDRDYITFVALLDNNVLGLISAVTFLWAGSEKKHMLIQGFAVKNEHQNKGVGTKLLLQIENYAKSQGIIGIGLCSDLKRTAALTCFEKNGYSKITQYFGKYISS